MFSREQYEQLRSFPEISRDELLRYFTLTSADVAFVDPGAGRGPADRLALQICTVRYVGRFLVDDPLDVPWSVIEHLAAQLRIEDPSVVKRYTERAKTAYEHAWEIRDAYSYHPFEDAEWGRKFRAFLHGRRGRALRGRWRCSTRRWAGCGAIGLLLPV
jgi:hypothetical protein